MTVPLYELCQIHNVRKPDDDQTFRICLECNHAFQTEVDLIRDHNALLTKMRGSHDPGPFPNEGFDGPVSPDVTSADAIYTCPHCAHDF